MKYFIALVAVVILAVALKANSQSATSQFRPCVWPNTCKSSELPLPTLIQKNAIAQFTTCVWPNRCVKAI